MKFLVCLTFAVLAGCAGGEPRFYLPKEGDQRVIVFPLEPHTLYAPVRPCYFCYRVLHWAKDPGEEEAQETALP